MHLVYCLYQVANQNHDPILAGCQIHVKLVGCVSGTRGQTVGLGGVELPETAGAARCRHK